MENQHRLIRGYRDLSAEEIALMNEIKAKGLELQALLERAGAAGADGRWLAIGTTHLQQGLMAVTRAVAKPEGF